MKRASLEGESSERSMGMKGVLEPDVGETAPVDVFGVR